MAFKDGDVCETMKHFRKAEIFGLMLIASSFVEL